MVSFSNTPALNSSLPFTAILFPARYVI